jgi:sulfide:quinone oxidoreductase
MLALNKGGFVMVSKHQIVIIGGGTAGITVAARLRRTDRALDIALIEPSSKHYYQPLWTLVGAGVVKKETTEHEESRYIPRGVKWIKDYVEDVDPDSNRVITRNGDEIHYDYLVVAPGIQLNWDKVKGLKETLGKNGVCSNYSYELVDYTWETVRNFKGGTAIFTNPAGQVKCGGAPQKIMYLVEDYTRRHGLRDKTTIMGAFAGTKMLGVPEINMTLERIVQQRGIDMRFHHNLCAIDGEKKEATFEVTDGDMKKVVTLPFDMIHVTPPQSAPDFIKRSKLVAKDGSNADWVSVDINTLQHLVYPNVFSLGDVAALPTAKTGAAIRKQAPVLVKNLLAVIQKETLSASYNGYSSCPLVTGYGKLVLAEFTYGNKYKPTFPVDQTKERYDMYLLKRYLLPQMYWHGMLRGWA